MKAKTYAIISTAIAALLFALCVVLFASVQYQRSMLSELHRELQAANQKATVWEETARKMR